MALNPPSSVDEAESLRRTGSKQDEDDQDGNPVSSSQEGYTDESPTQMAAPAKRVQVAVACKACRRRKNKCDALRPCTSCATKGLICQYETQAGETRTQASKRKYDEITRSHDIYEEIFHMLATRPGREGAAILQHIQSGYHPEAVLRIIKTNDAASAMLDLRGLRLKQFLVVLAHSTGSLRDIIGFATKTLDPTSKVQLPSPEEFQIFRNRVVHLPYVETLLQQSQQVESIPTPLLLPNPASLSSATAAPGFRPVNPGSDNDRLDSSQDFDTPCKVPAAPWTTITANDEAVSHLISTFLAWINPTWRFVEQDLFLLGMRSRWLDSDFCSPFLVNSICAIASMHSEHEVAFAQQDKDRISRGQHFHDEALRLWVLEESRPTMTNIQALCVLSLESNYRAKDRLGLTLCPIAVRLNNEVPMYTNERQCAHQGISQREWARARLATHWMAVCTHVITRIAFMSSATTESRTTGVPKIHEVFDDTVEFWVGYPLARSVVAHRPTLYLRERCKLAGLFQDMHKLIFAGDIQNRSRIRDFASATDQMSAKLQQWYRYLPFELRYEWPISVAILELQFVHFFTDNKAQDTDEYFSASYLAFHMTLWVVARSRYQEVRSVADAAASPTDHEDDDAAFRERRAQEALARAIPLAHMAAQTLRDFRQHYGFKVSPAWLLQLQAVTAGVLLQDPELADSSNSASQTSGDHDGTIQDSHTAFDEVFRCLLGSGVEVMVARGIARMMYHSALDHRVALSRSTRSMLQIMSDTAWRPSDLALVNSTFPNFATTKGYEGSERMTELLSKWEKLEI